MRDEREVEEERGAERGEGREKRDERGVMREKENTICTEMHIICQI